MKKDHQSHTHQRHEITSNLDCGRYPGPVWCSLYCSPYTQPPLTVYLLCSNQFTSCVPAKGGLLLWWVARQWVEPTTFEESALEDLQSGAQLPQPYVAAKHHPCWLLSILWGKSGGWRLEFAWDGGGGGSKEVETGKLSTQKPAQVI